MANWVLRVGRCQHRAGGADLHAHDRRERERERERERADGFVERVHSHRVRECNIINNTEHREFYNMCANTT